MGGPRLSLSAAHVITPAGTLSPGTVEMAGGRITAVTEGGTDVLDVTLAPGFVDVQVNGIGSVDVADADGADWDQLDRLLVAQGVTAWCPTLISQPLARYHAALERMATAAARPGARPAILGAHLEGPFLGGAPGAHRREWLVPIDEAWLRDLPDIVRMVTLAPELDGAAAGIKALRARGVVASLGHSTASYQTTLEGAEAGATLVTHCFNGMGPLHHRQPGLLGAALTDDRLMVSLIADLVHVHPAALALAFRAKGVDRVILVTDAVAWDAPGARIRIEGGAPRLEDGTLAGSCLAMDTAIANVVATAGVPLADAVRAASTNPADLLAEEGRGRIQVGACADLVALDDGLRVTGTWISGERVFGLR